MVLMTNEVQEPEAAYLRIGDRAPDFEARSTTGLFRLSACRGRWLILFSHPADFTPVCTTEFVELAHRAGDFEERNSTLAALSIDSLLSHFAWLRLIRDRFGVEVRFPIVEDPTLVIGRAFGMVSRTAQDSSTVRTTFFIDPEGRIRALSSYPANVGRSIPEVLRTLDALQATDAHDALAPANWTAGKPLLQAPCYDLDEVYKAEDGTSWFFRETAQRATSK